MPVQQLIQIIAELADAHRELLELAEQKRVALVRNELKDIMAIVNKETKLSKRVADLQQAQTNAVNEFFRQKGFQPTREITITELSRMITDIEAKQALIDRRDRLVELIAELKQRNDLNQQLIKQSLDFVNYSIDVIAGPPEDEMTYQRPAQQSPTTGRTGVFDWKA